MTGPLHRVTMGDAGPVMLFLHPNPLDWSCWLYQLTSFSNRYRAVAVDLPGYGRSPSATAGITMTDVANACWETADEFTDDPIVVVGCSVGSWIAVEMARLRPRHVGALAMSGVGYSPVKPFAAKRISGYEDQGIGYRRTHAYDVVSAAFGRSEVGAYLIEEILGRDDQVDVFTVIEVFRALGEPDPDDFWSGISVPTLIITGELDPVHPRALDLADRIPGVEIVTIHGAGHTCSLEQPWHFDAALRSFLDRLEL